MPSSLRQELDRLEFNWDDGVAIMQGGTGHQTPRNTRTVEKVDPILDLRFSNGSGFLDMPRFMAADSLAVYVPYRDRHGSGLRRIFHEPAEYLERGEPIPYPED